MVRKNTVKEGALIDDQLNSKVGIRESAEVVYVRQPSSVCVLGAELVVSIARVGVFCHDVHTRVCFVVFTVGRILIVPFDPA